jgi:hypothetical protein
VAEAMPTLDPALEQRIRSIFRDTALGGGDQSAGSGETTKPRVAALGNKDKL